MAQKFLNGILSVDGSNSSPSYGFIGRTNTGMYAANHGNYDRIWFAVDGTNRFYIDANGVNIAAGNLYVPSGNSVRNYSGIWQATTGTTEKGFVFTNTADSQVMFEAQHDFIRHTSDGAAADGATLYLKHANNNSTDTIGTIFFGNNADTTLSKIVAETNGANNTSNLKFGTSNAGTIGTALTLNADNSATFAGAVTATHFYSDGTPNQNLLDIASIKIAGRDDIYANATKTVISDYVAKYVNDNTGGTTVRIYVDDNILVDGDPYMVSVYYENLIGTLGIDFADTTVTGNGSQTGTSSAPKSGRIYGHATRADYTSTFRFVDINLSQGSGHEVTLHSPKVEAGTTLTDFVATERTDIPTNSMHVRELIATSDATFAGDITTSGNIYLNNNKTIFSKNTSGSNYGLLTITSGNVIKLGAYAYTSAATEIGLGDNGKFLIGTAEALSINSSKEATFAGAGTFETTLNVSATDSGGSPAMTAVMNMHGYDQRGVGIKMKDNKTTSGGSTDAEWFVGTGYNSTGFNIGYASDGSQSSYPAQAKLAITTAGNATFAGTVTANGTVLTGNQTLPTDFVSAANGGTFSGNVNVFPNASTGTFRVGRYSGQEFKLHATDLTNTLTSINDADENQGHEFILNRVHAGTGADDFKIQKDGSNQLTIDKDGLADFVSHIKADNVGSGTTIVRPGTDAQWGASGSTTGRIEITLPGTTATSNHGMVYLQIDVYEYQSGIGPSTYFVGGHNWNNGWHHYNAHKIGKGSKKIYLGVRNSRYVVLIGDANSSWSYGSVHVSYASNGTYYSSNMDMVDGVTTHGSGQWSATQVTHADSAYTNLRSDLAATVDFKGSDLKADSFVVDGGASTSFLKADGSLDSTTYTTGTIPTDFVSAANGGTFGGTVSISPGSSAVSILNLRRDTTGDDTIVSDINFLTTAAQGTDDRIGLIRSKTSAGDGSNRGGAMLFYTRKSSSADFNTTTYNKDGAWYFPSSIAATTLDTGHGANELYAMDQAVRTTDNVEFADLTVANLTVTGTNTILNTTTVEVEDNIILLNKTASDGSATASSSGIAINRGGTTADASFIFGESDDYWDLTHNFQVAGDAIVSGGDLTVTKQNGSPVITMLRDGNNPNANTLLQHLQFTVDYGGAHQEWGGIEHRTTTSGTRTKLNFNVKSTSGNVLNALSLDGTTDGTEAIFGGNARLPSSGKLYTWTGHNGNFLDYRNWQASSSAGMSIINTASAGHLFLKTNSLTGLEIDELGGTTVTGHTIPVGGTVLDVQGTQGQLFSVTNDLTGDLFEVSDISGSPILTVNSSGAVTVDGDITATSTTVSGAASVGGNLDVAEYIRHIGDLNTFLQFPGTNDKLIFTTNGSTVLTIDANNKSTFTGAMVVGPGTTGTPYDATTFLHVKGTTRSIVQQSSTADAYYMFGDAAANNVAWVGYNHSSGTLDLHAETAITLDKNTTITGNISATNLSGTNTGDQDLSGYATTGSIPTDFVSKANGGTFSGSVVTPNLTVNGVLKWATTGSSYTYSNDDASGMYIERVATTNALSDIRIQGRPPVSSPQSPAYQYTSLHIKPSNHSIVLNTSGTTALSVNSAQKTTMHGGFEGLANSYITTSGTTLLTLTGSGNGYVNAGIVLSSDDDDGHSRGGGIYMNNTAGQTEWFMGRPYSSADQFQINRRATTAGTHHDATAEGGGTTISGHGTTETLLNIDASGNMTITGNLTVQGATTTLNTATLDVEDLNITVGKDTTNSSTSDGAGITFGGYSGAPQFYWHHTNDTLYANESIQATRFYGPVTGNVTGNASGSSGSCTGNSATATLADDAHYIRAQDNRTISPSEHTAGKMRFGFTSWGNSNSAPYADFLNMRSYTDSSGGADNLIMFKKSGIGMRIWQQSFGSSTAYASYHNVYSLPYEYNQSNTDVDTGATRDIAAVSDTVGNAVFFDFVIKKGSNVRAGTVYTCHNGTDVEFTETSTADIGDTSDVTLSVVRHSNQIKLQAVTTTNDWSIKTLIRHI